MASDSRNPTRHGMQELLGALTIVCNFLEGRITPFSRFKNFPISNCRNAIRQRVKFNIPLPSGVACRTLTRGKMDALLQMVIHRVWDCCYNFLYPAVMGVNEKDTELLNLNQWLS